MIWVVDFLEAMNTVILRKSDRVFLLSSLFCYIVKSFYFL